MLCLCQLICPRYLGVSLLDEVVHVPPGWFVETGGFASFPLALSVLRFMGPAVTNPPATAVDL